MIIAMGPGSVAPVGENFSCSFVKRWPMFRHSLFSAPFALRVFFMIQGGLVLGFSITAGPPSRVLPISLAGGFSFSACYGRATRLTAFVSYLCFSFVSSLPRPMLWPVFVCTSRSRVQPMLVTWPMFGRRL